MKLLRIDYPQNCEASYPEMLRGWSCRGCGRFGRGRQYGYATVDADKVRPLLPLGTGPMECLEAQTVYRAVRPLFPEYAWIGPGIQFGKPKVKVLFKHKDMLFHASGIIVTEAGNVELAHAGLKGLVSTPVVGSFGKKTGIPLFSLEFPACLDEAPQFFQPGQCSVCNSQTRTTKEHATIALASVRPDADVMGYRSGAVSFIVVTEKFRDAAMHLHGGNGLKFFPVPIFD